MDRIQEIRSLAKELSSVCSVILVLSEANAALEFSRGVYRETFIFVDEFADFS